MSCFGLAWAWFVDVLVLSMFEICCLVRLVWTMVWALVTLEFGDVWGFAIGGLGFSWEKKA